MDRKSNVSRTTSETDIQIEIIILLKMSAYCWVKLSGKLLEIKEALKEWLMLQYLWMSQ